MPSQNTGLGAVDYSKTPLHFQLHDACFTSDNRWKQICLF